MESMIRKQIYKKIAQCSHIDTDNCIKGKIVGSVRRYEKLIIPRAYLRVRNAKSKEKLAEVVEIQEIVSRNQRVYGSEELFFDIVQHFPYPVFICGFDGTMVVANKSFLDFVKRKDQNINYKEYNVLNNPYVEKWGLKKFLLRAYAGETINVNDVKIPYEELVEIFGGNKELISESLFINITVFPILNENNEVLYTVTVFVSSRHYKDRDEIIKGREYIETHWKDKFDAEKLTDLVFLSRYDYSRLFKQYTGMTPFQYYQNIKVMKLKEKFRCTDLSIAEAFLECGIDYNGNFGKTFKKITGMTPSEYRMKVKKN